MTAPDFTVLNGGSVSIVTPLTDAARAWLDEHTDPDAQWFAGGIAVEHRYVRDLVVGLAQAGFTVEAA
jgi:hypothetical protein